MALKKLIFLISIYTVTSAWTFALVDKPGSREFNQARTYVEHQEYTKAEISLHDALKKAIDHELQANVMVDLASIYSKDYITGKTELNAVPLLNKAIGLGNRRAHLHLGDIYRSEVAPYDIQKAVASYKEVSGEYAAASLALAELAQDRNVVLQHFVTAIDLLKIDATPSASVVQSIAGHYANGTIVNANPTLAEEWFRKAIELGSESAPMQLADLLVTQRAHPSQIIPLWEKAAMFNDPRAMIELGMTLATGWGGVERNMDGADMYFRQAVAVDPRYAYRIARRFEDTERHEENDLYAASWFLKAANYGDPDGLLRAARMYWRGDYVEQDMDRARAMYTQAAVRGNPKAQPELAKYEENLRQKLARKQNKKIKRAKFLTAQNLSEWQNRANGGEPHAMHVIGNAYLHGQVVKQNVETAMQWFIKASANKETQSMVELARIYSAGLAVPMNLDEAYSWYKKAAALGNPEAQYQLGLGYARGIGVPQDADRAKKLFAQAKKNGYTVAESVLQFQEQ